MSRPGRLVAFVARFIFLVLAVAATQVAFIAAAPRVAEATGVGKIESIVHSVLRRLTIITSENAYSTPQPLDADLTAIGGLTRTRGDLIYGGAAAWQDLAPGTVDLPLVSNGAGADPAYEVLPIAGGGTGATTAAAARAALGTLLETLDVQDSTSGTSRTYTVPANTLNGDEDSLLVIYAGTSSGANQSVTVTFGGTTVFATITEIDSGGHFFGLLWLKRLTSSTQASHGMIVFEVPSTDAVVVNDRTTSARDLTTDQDLVVTGSASTAVKGLLVLRLDAP